VRDLEAPSPPVKEVTQRFTEEEFKAYLKGPMKKGGKHIYCIAWPAY
jgi:hypothetical protein